MPTIIVSSHHRNEVSRTFGVWQKVHGGAIQSLPPMSTTPDGRDLYVMVPDSLVSELVRRAIPYEPISG